MSRDASNVVGSMSSRPMYSAIFRAKGSYSSADTVRSSGRRTRNRGAAGLCLRVL